jgi:hypothetical protein
MIFLAAIFLAAIFLATIFLAPPPCGSYGTTNRDVAALACLFFFGVLS